MHITWYWESLQIQEWINDIMQELLYENYRNRGRLQKQLLVLERAKSSMYKARHNLGS